MKAFGTCPRCGKGVTTDCAGCMGAGTVCGHDCKASKEAVIEGVQWKRFAENEEELADLESEESFR